MIYLIRHGQSVGNAANRHQTPELSLSDMGREQAKQRAQTLKDKNISKIIVSPYIRAQQTGGIIQAELGQHIPLTLYQDLREVKNPSALDGRLKTDPDVMQLKAKINRNRLDPDYRHSDEETLFMLHQRVLSLLDFIALLSDQNTLLVSHAGVLRMILAYLQTQTNAQAAVAKLLALQDDPNFELNNVAMITLDYQNKQWKIQQVDNLF